MLLANGDTIDIADVRIGDMVFAHDPETGLAGPREVLATWPHTDTLVEFDCWLSSALRFLENEHGRVCFVLLVVGLAAPLFVGSAFEQWDTADAGQERGDKER